MWTSLITPSLSCNVITLFAMQFDEFCVIQTAYIFNLMGCFKFVRFTEIKFLKKMITENTYAL